MAGSRAGFRPFPAPPQWPGLTAEQLKIIVVSTPKTGNTWLKHLLAAAYGLPMPLLPVDHRQIDWPALGPRWVAHQHYAPEQPLLEAARAHGVVFVTTIRHPADVFVSLVHHAAKQQLAPAAEPEEAGFMRHDDQPFGEHTRRFLREGFFFQLHLSLSWLRGGWALPVRYEDLWSDPLGALRRLTDQILPVRPIRLRLAVAGCEIREMQRTLDPGRSFFRKGGIGGWIEELPPAFQELLATVEPYPTQLAALGYSMDRSDPPAAAGREPDLLINPFGRSSRFDNGVKVHPVLIDIFRELPDALIERWPDALRTGPGSYYGWLNAPTEEDPLGAGAHPAISHFADALYRSRPDVQVAFPDRFGAHREAFVRWFCSDAQASYGFDLGFCFSAWPSRRADGTARPNPFLEGGAFDNGVPVPPVAAAVFWGQPEDRADRWLRQPAATGPGSFYDWLNAPAAADPRGSQAVPMVTELAAFLYSTRQDVRAAFPDPFGANRTEFADWFLIVGRTEYRLDRVFRLPVVNSVALGAAPAEQKPGAATPAQR